MTGVRTYVISFLMLFGALVQTASGQYSFTGRDDVGEAAVEVDHADFRSDQSGMNRLEIYY